MKRFWTDVRMAGEAGGFAVQLDDKPMRTPGRRPLLVPTEALAAAIAGEWQAVAEQVDPRLLPLTGLANAAIDIVAPDAPAFARPLAAYADSDLLLYRADEPDSLVVAQASAWDPLLGWAARRYEVRFDPVSGIIHRSQPAATLSRLEAALLARDAFSLAALSPLVTIGGSLVVALALAEDAVSADQAWDAVTLDERWQEERWGADPIALDVRAARRVEFDSALRFLAELR